VEASESAPDTIKFKKRPTKAKLTKRTVEALAPPAEIDGKPAQTWTYDSQTPRLAICTWSSGAKVWYWVGRGWDGRMMRFKLGGFPEITPEQARKLAGKVSADVANGIDPREDRWRARKELTLGELFDRYLEEHAKLHKQERSWKDDEKQFRRYCGQLKSRALSTISRGEVMTFHARIGKEHGKVAANRLLALLSKMFSFAADLGFPGANPVRGIQRFREESRDRFLNADELQRFFKALGDETQLFQDFFRVLLLTGARRGNVEAMRFEQIDFGESTWRIPATKNGQPLTVHLVKEAADILRQRHAESSGNPWVFPGGKKNPHGHLNSPKGAWARILVRAGLGDVHIHDLRRTLGSWQAATGASLPVIGKTLGHKNQATTAIYARLNLDPVRASVDTAVAAMMAAAQGGKGLAAAPADKP
jgi:integrase